MKAAFCALTLLASAPGLCDTAMREHMDDDPLNVMLMLDRFEIRNGKGADPLSWEGRAWIGRDFSKLLLRSEGEAVDGHAASAELEALWMRPVSRWWDLVVGARHEFKPKKSRDWLALGVVGLAPYRIHVQATGYVSEGGRTALRLETDCELLVTNHLILEPRMELNAYGKKDFSRGLGSGISDLELGLRLRYEIRREIAPYLGAAWVNRFGSTAGLARANGEDAHELQVLAGLRVWY
jgi:copper resistance protein B